MDVLDSIEPGVAFRDAIDAAVSSCDVLLAVIGRRWLMLTDSTGRRRLDDPEDLLRFEIAKALSRNVRVIPVLVEGATMPRSEDLPEDLRALAARQAIDLSENRWNFDVTRLLDTLDKLLTRKPGGGRVPAWLRAVIGAAALIAVATTGWILLPGGSKSTSSDPKPPPSDGRNKPPATLVLVPDVRGMALDAATERIRESGLVVGLLTYYTLSGGTPGTVYAQDTAGGTRVRPESKIGLSVVRQRPSGTQSSGSILLSHTQVFDLDGTNNDGRRGIDIRFDASNPREPLLQVQNGATLGEFGRSPPVRATCEKTNLSTSRIRLHVGTYLCARTDEGRYALLRIDDLSDKLRLTFNTWAEPLASDPLGGQGAAPGTRVRLVNSESYDFSSRTRGKLSGGDFYLNIGNNGAAQFFANNRGQRGLIDLGDIGSPPLDSVRPPATGYSKFGVPVVEGHTYVSLAAEGEEGHHVIFRVTSVTDTFAALAYIYR
jgi:hypothetical protein